MKTRRMKMKTDAVEITWTEEEGYKLSGAKNGDAGATAMLADMMTAELEREPGQSHAPLEQMAADVARRFFPRAEVVEMNGGWERAPEGGLN